MSPLLVGAAVGVAVCAVLFLRGYRRTAHFFWFVTICLVSLPFESFQTHSHWDKIGWIPFYSWPVRPLDIVGNVLLYMPLGYLAVERGATILANPFATTTRKHERQLLNVRVAVEALLLSLTMEAIQDFSHSRFPSATDLVCNVAGALLGVALARRR